MKVVKSEAAFWIGVGEVATGIVVLSWLMLPAGSCEVLLGWAVACPPPWWALVLLLGLVYALTAMVCRALGLHKGGWLLRLSPANRGGGRPPDGTRR